MSNRRTAERSRGSRPALHRPVRWVVEGLEGRLLLSAVSWTGAGDGVNWTDPKNWSTDALPGSTDTVTISAAGDPTITLASGSQSVGSLTSTDPLTISSGAALAAGSTIGGSGTVTNNGTLTLKATTVNAPLVNQGMLVVTNTGNTITGAFTGSAGSTLSLDDNNNYATLTISGPFTNDGTIALSTEGNAGYDVTLTVSSGATLTNAADGTITAAGTGTDAQTITGALIDKGMLSVQHNLTMNNSSLDATSGTLSITAGQTLRVNGGTLSLGSTVLSGTGTLDATGDTVNLLASQTLTAAAVRVVLAGATVNGPGTLTNAAGNTLALNNTKINAPLVNQGTVVATNTGNTTTDGFTGSPGSTLSLDDNNSHAILTISGSFTNDGTIALSTESNAGYTVALTVAPGATLTNASDGTITASGTGADQLAINGALSNQGTLSVQSVKLTVQNPMNLASNVLSNGTWNVSGGGKLILPDDLTTNAANIALIGPASIITNSSGTTNALSSLVMNAAGAGLTLTGGQALAVTPAGGTFSNDGTLTVGAGSELSVTGALTQNVGALLSIQIGGPTSANFGQVIASGTAAAGGNLQGSFVNSYDPPAAQAFAVLNASIESGTFATILGLTPSGRILLAQYRASSASIVIGPIGTTTTLASQSPNPSNASEPLVFAATVSGGVPNGESFVLEDASNGDTVVAGGTISNGSAPLTIPAGTLQAGTHNLIAVYGGDANFAASQSAAYVQSVQVAVTGVVVNGNMPGPAGAQRSRVDSIVYTFSEAVNLAATNAVSIEVHSGKSGTAPTLNWAALNPNTDGSSRQWVVTFTGAGVSGGSIADGVYDITLNAAAATSDANPSVSSQARATDTFYRLFGDAQGTGKVNTADYTAFLSSFGLKSTAPGYLAYFADDGTGKIDTADYNAFLGNFGKKLSGFTATI